jgi:hypothetical protein
MGAPEHAAIAPGTAISDPDGYRIEIVERVE